MKTTDLFNQAGAALYGPLFRSEMARVLGRQHTQICRWANGEYNPPADVWRQIASLCDARRIELAQMAVALAEAGRETGPHLVKKNGTSQKLRIVKSTT